MERRDLLRAGALAAAVAIAGCADDEADDTDDTADEPEEADADDGDPETDDGDTDEDDSLDDDDTDDEADDEDADDEDADDDTDEDDEVEEDDGEEDDEADDGEDDDVEDDDDTEDEAGDAESEGVLFAETVEFEDSYAFETEGTGEAGETFASRGRVDGENTYMVMEEGGEEIELYTVDGETYIVEGEECMILPGMADEEFEEEDVEDPDAEAEAHPDLEDSGRTTIESVEEEVYVFEIDGDEAAEHDEDVTYYVGVETGYVHRIESGPSITDFYSWGEADPVEPPEMDCMSLGDFDEDDLPI